MCRTKKAYMVVLICMAFAATTVRANTISITFNQPSQTGQPGDTLQFFASIINTDSNFADAPVYFNLDSLNLSLNDALLNDLFFANVPISLAPGESSGPIELFEFTLANPSANPFGVYQGAYTLLGGMDGGAGTAQDTLGQANFSVGLAPAGSAITPEPPTLLLLITGMVAAWLFHHKRRSNLAPFSVRLSVTRLLIFATAFIFAPASRAQYDPGPRAGPSDAGVPFEKLKDEELKLYWAARDIFKEVNSVSGTIERGVGLGPVFNGNSCAGCHAQPAAGGSSPSPHSLQVSQLQMHEGRLRLAPQINPQIPLATIDRDLNTGQSIPSFLSPDGPVRVARVIAKPDGSPDGNVLGIYTIAGRLDAPGCHLTQPNFTREMANHNLSFRIPTPAYGGGLIEAVTDEFLQDNLFASADQKRMLGIYGRFNRVANDGTISRFGWKAQGKSLFLFAAESYSVEEGVTSELFPNERSSAHDCQFNNLPEDTIRLQMLPGATFQTSGFASDVANFGAFMRLLAAPKQSVFSASAQSGSVLFKSVGCVLCHSASLTTGKSQIEGMSDLEIHPYSDYALHHMGPGLADHISQGVAGGDEFRTAPLWGLGQRIFFLHDGRTENLLTAIEAHMSVDRNCRARQIVRLHSEACVSEGNAVVAKFNDLPTSQKQDILNFLRSL